MAAEAAFDTGGPFHLESLSFLDSDLLTLFGSVLHLLILFSSLSYEPVSLTWRSPRSHLINFSVPSTVTHRLQILIGVGMNEAEV